MDMAHSLANILLQPPPSLFVTNLRTEYLEQHISLLDGHHLRTTNGCRGRNKTYRLHCSSFGLPNLHIGSSPVVKDADVHKDLALSGHALDRKETLDLLRRNVFMGGVVIPDSKGMPCSYHAWCPLNDAEDPMNHPTCFVVLSTSLIESRLLRALPTKNKRPNQFGIRIRREINRRRSMSTPMPSRGSNTTLAHEHCIHCRFRARSENRTTIPVCLLGRPRSKCTARAPHREDLEHS